MLQNVPRYRQISGYRIQGDTGAEYGEIQAEYPKIHSKKKKKKKKKKN